MKTLRLLSLIGILLSLLLHLGAWLGNRVALIHPISWLLHGGAISILWYLRWNQALPLQRKSDTSWLRRTPSLLNGLIVFAFMSFVFHFVWIIAGFSADESEALRLFSSGWIYFFGLGYAYALTHRKEKSKRQVNKPQNTYETDHIQHLRQGYEVPPYGETMNRIPTQLGNRQIGTNRKRG